MPLLRFVQTIEPNPTVRLDLHDGELWLVQPTTQFQPPGIKRARVSTLLADGAHYPADAYDDRTLELRLALLATSDEQAASEVQKLARELDRPGGNILQVQPRELTHPVFFRTHRLGLDEITWFEGAPGYAVEVNVPAEPFAYGLPEYLQPALNANPTFDASISSWSARGGGLVLDGTVGDYASTPDHASLDITGDIDIRADATAVDWTPSGNQYLVAKFQATGNQRSYRMFIQSSGIVSLAWSADGIADIIRNSTVAPTVTNGAPLAIRATLDVDNGAAQHVVTFYTGPSLAGPWTQLGAAVTNAGTTSIFAGTAPLEVGSVAGGTAVWVGTIHGAQVRSGIGGTLVAGPDFASQPAGTTSFVDSAGRTWTVQGGADIVTPAIAHDTTTVYEGAGSLRLTPDGVTPDPKVVSESIAVVASRNYVASTWVQIPTGYSSVRVAADWYDSGSALLSTSTGTSYTAPAGEWVYVSALVTAAVSATTGRLKAELTGTPPATAVAYFDDAQLREAIALLNNPATTPNGMFVDFDGIKGDVEAPLLLREYGLEWINGSVLFATRRAGDVTAVPYALQAEAMVQGT
ncbi:MAG TPA: hypothetical protein VGW74_21020, partial [Propionibacteriaceae bacterium]|nr:hypothetical protein [Propionibacteriaceae bacterium]